MGRQSVYPTGTTIYNPEKCFNGYTLFPAANLGAVLIDMNGKVVHLWKDLQGFPNKLLPGGIVFGHRGERDRTISYQDKIDLVEVDWEGKIIWKYNHHEFIEDPGIEPQWMARCHHDYQREGNPVGYYVPGMEAKVDSGKTLILAHKDVYNKRISEHLLIDDCISEVDWEGNKIWEWEAHKHFQELGFDEFAKNAIHRDPNIVPGGQDGLGDWLHINSASYLGANQWYDGGDERFHPDNIMIDSREANIMAIISKKTGKFVWKLGPDYTLTKELRLMGIIIGMHHAHMIPKGLPGEGNILVFDNGGWAGYGAPSQTSKIGIKVYRRDYSRILEFNPITLKVVWQCSPSELGFKNPQSAHYFYSPLVSSAQRLPNGNTLITEGTCGRLFEVTNENEIVWEYNSPYYKKDGSSNLIYRAYRYPYDWVPQIQKPKETAITPVDNNTFRLPGAAGPEYEAVSTCVEGTWGYGKGGAFCVEKVE
ncbi:MAG: aryl-sulfate sulfotransferase [Dehalobacterium sp.]